MVHRVLEKFLLVLFVSGAECNKILWRGRKDTVDLHIYVYLLSNCFVSTSNQSALWVMWNTSTAAVILGFSFSIRVDGFTILYSERAFYFLFMFSLIYKVAVNL